MIIGKFSPRFLVRLRRDLPAVRVLPLLPTRHERVVSSPRLPRINKSRCNSLFDLNDFNGSRDPTTVTTPSLAKDRNPVVAGRIP